MKSFHHEEKKFKGSYEKKVFNTLYLSYQPWIKTIILIFILGIIGRTCMLFITNVIGFWADTFCQDATTSCHPLPSFFKSFENKHFALFILILSLLSFFLNLIFRISISRIGTHAVSRLYDEVTYRVSRYPMVYFDATPVGRILTRFSSDYASMFRMAGGPMGEFLTIIMDLVLIIILMAITNIYYIPLILLSMSISTFIYKKNIQRNRNQRRELSRARSPSIAHFSETVQGSTMIRTYHKEKNFILKFQELLFKLSQQKIQTTFILNEFSFILSSSTSLMILFTGIVGLILYSYNIVSIGSLAVALTFVSMSITTVTNFFEWLTSLEEAMTGVERFDEYLRNPLEPFALLPASAEFNTSQGQESPSSPIILPPKASITFKNATFQYRPELPLILHNLSFHLPEGKSLGIIGHTGCGKSTIIQALFQLYPLQEGEILIQNENLLEKMPIHEYRKYISYIPQDPILFRGSLLQNLQREETDNPENILKILHHTGISKLLPSCENLLEFFIEENGKNLSTGQRQLLCLARCMIQNTPIVLMDEATSAIDISTEEFILNTMKTYFQDKTRIIIAHRIETIKQCDFILWLEDGKAKMFGKPSEILSQYITH